MAEQAAQEPKGPLPAVQRQDAADGARLADAPRVRALGDIGRQLNARPPQPAQRALTGGISGGAPIQGKFRFWGTVLKTDALLEENPPDKVRPYITSDTVYDVRDDWDVSFNKLHLIDPAKVYLLGEIHDQSQWGPQTRQWSRIHKMLEEKRAFSNVDMGQNDDKQNQALEDVRAAMLHMVLVARSELLRLRADTPVPDKGVVDLLHEAYGHILSMQGQFDALAKSLADFEQFRDEHPALVALSPKMRKEGNFMNSAAIAHSLSNTLKTNIAIKPATAQSRENIKDCKELLLMELPTLSEMAGALATSMGLHPEGRMGKPVFDEAASDAPVDEPVDSAGMAIRDAVMARNINAAERPLLVQIGDAHVPGVARQVADTVKVRAGQTLASKTKV